MLVDLLVAEVFVTREAGGLLADGGGDDGLDAAVEGEARSSAGPGDGGVARAGGRDAVRQVVEAGVVVGGYDADASGRRGGVGGALDLAGAQRGVDEGERLVEDAGRADDERLDAAPQVGVSEGFGGDLGPDSNGVAEGYGDAGDGVHGGRVSIA